MPIRPVSIPSRAKSQRCEKGLVLEIFREIKIAHPSFHAIAAPKTKNSIGEKGGDNLGGLVRHPEPTEPSRQFPSSIPVAQVENVVRLSLVSTSDLGNAPRS